MQAIILAAGMGKRLKELTQDNTKCMVKVNGVSLIDRMLHQIEKLHLDRIVIVVGFEGQKLIDYIGTLDISIPITFVDNPIYYKTNNIYSLALAKALLFKHNILIKELTSKTNGRNNLRLAIKNTEDNNALISALHSELDGNI